MHKTSTISEPLIEATAPRAAPSGDTGGGRRAVGAVIGVVVAGLSFSLVGAGDRSIARVPVAIPAWSLPSPAAALAAERETAWEGEQEEVDASYVVAEQNRFAAFRTTTAPVGCPDTHDGAKRIRADVPRPAEESGDA